MADLMLKRSAVVIGSCRLILERDFQRPGPVLSVGMVNPSLADGERDDPTMIRIHGFAERLRASRVLVWNKFAHQSPDVRTLRNVADPVGPENDRYIEQALRQSDICVVAWGPLSKLPPHLMNRWREVVAIADKVGCVLHCWGTAKDGHPRHPLMVPGATPLTGWMRPQ